MKLQDKVVVVTGGANGIGRALCRRFAAEGARGVVVSDLDFDAASKVAAEINGLAVKTDVASEADIGALVAKTNEAFGPIDLFCSNAGIGGMPGFEQVTNEAWRQIWEINVMAHIFAARAVLPQMLERGEGYLLNTASAAGLLTQIGSAPYSVTKHAGCVFRRMAGDHVWRPRDQGLLPVPARREDKPPDVGRAHRLRRFSAGGRNRTGRRGRSRRPRPGRREVSDPAASGSRRIFQAQGERLRPLAARHAAIAGSNQFRQGLRKRLRKRRK